MPQKVTTKYSTETSQPPDNHQPFSLVWMQHQHSVLPLSKELPYNPNIQMRFWCYSIFHHYLATLATHTAVSHTVQLWNHNGSMICPTWHYGTLQIKTSSTPLLTFLVVSAVKAQVPIQSRMLPDHKTSQLMLNRRHRAYQTCMW